MSAISYTVGAIPIPIALQIMAQLGKAQIMATITPTDQDTAAIEVALFNRTALDDLLKPFEAQLRSARPMIDTSLPFGELHASIMAGRYSLGQDGDDHDAFTGLLISYQTVAHDSALLDGLADVCNRRIARAHLPLDLVAAYGALARLARWRAEMLRSTR